MRIAIPSSGKQPNAFLSSHFGKAKYMALVDVSENVVTSIQFKEFPHLTCGELAINLRKEGVDTIITNALAARLTIVLDKFNITIFRAFGLSVNQALNSWLNGKREEMPLEDIHHHIPNPGIKGGLHST